MDFQQKLIFSFLLLWIVNVCAPTKKKQPFWWQQWTAEQVEPMQALFSHPGRYTSPTKKKQVEQKILSLIDNAKTEIRFYVYSFNHPEIIDALVSARERGVKLYIIGDTEKDYRLARKQGLRVNQWKHSGLHHIKIIIVDMAYILYGTGNFSEYGLQLNHNGYIYFPVSPNEAEKFQNFIEFPDNQPFLTLKDIIFINSPDYGYLIQDSLLKAIAAAEQTIDFLIFDHFDTILTHALKKASARGVRVRGIYDSPIDEQGEILADNLFNPQSMLYTDGNEDIVQENDHYYGGLLHHKTMIIDGKTLYTGSYNYSSSARNQNREILSIVRQPDMVQAFIEEFERILARAHPYESKNTSTVSHIFANGLTSSTTEICINQSLRHPIVELASGIWQTYLYYPKWYGNGCISTGSYNSLSSALSINRFGMLYQNDRIWQGPVQIINQKGMTVYQNQASQKNVDSYSTHNQGSIASPSAKNNDNYTRITARQLQDAKITTIQKQYPDGFMLFSDGLTDSDLTIHFWQPGQQWQEMPLQQVDPSGQYSSQNDLVVQKSRPGIVFLTSANTTYFGCFADASGSLTTLDPLIHTINLQRQLAGLGHLQCKIMIN